MDILTINALLILKVWDIICFSRAKHITGHFAGFLEGDKTFLTPKLTWAFPGLSKSEVHWYFYVPKKEKREERREMRDERQETRDERRETSELENKSAGDYISKPPGPKWKIRGLHRKERYSMYLTRTRDS